MKKEFILSEATKQIETLFSDISEDQITEITNELMLIGNRFSYVLYSKAN